mgnify:FL=1
MLRFFTKRIMAKLSAHFLIVGLIPLILLGGITYIYSRSAIEANEFNHLTSINAIRKQEICHFLESGRENLSALSHSPRLIRGIQEGAYAEVNPLLEYFLHIFGYSDLLLLNSKGAVLHQVTDEAISPKLLAGISRSIKQADASWMSDLMDYEDAAQPALFMGAPVQAPDGQQLALLVFQIKASRINDFLDDHIGMGQTGETYLVGPDYRLRSNTRFLDQSAVLTKKIQTPAVERALANDAGTLWTSNYQGKETLAAYAGLNLKNRLGTDFNWAIVSEINSAEALGLLGQLGVNIIGTIVFLVILIAFMGYFQSRMIVKPVRSLSDQVLKLVNEGDFTAEIPEEQKNRDDEIGALIKTWAEGIERFRKQLSLLGKSTHNLLSSASQISSTASQLSASAAETSSSISEVTTTVEEVKQTSQLATDKAENVYKTAENTNKISLAGKQATENTGAGINRIKQEMNDIAESTVKLSEQTKSIEEIINTVSDIADQSNILSVNASIEAAKAGEHGKGFAVVAQEVKSLADQSKEATSQVRTILMDIQKATSTAVMATERGSKTVEEAIELAEQSGTAIDRLERQVNESSDAASQIMASNQQQLSGMDQLSEAMESINDATQQNLEGVKQLEDISKTLEEFAQNTRDMVSQYKV